MVRCSTLNEQHPTVSALSSPFSLPALIAKKSIIYVAVPSCQLVSSLELIKSLYPYHTSLITLFNYLAFSNFYMSDYAFTFELPAKDTYFHPPVISSIQVAIQKASFLCTIFSHDHPGIGHTGTYASFDKLRVMSSGMTLSFMYPDFGCIPLPLNIDLGSTQKFPIFSIVPSRMDKEYSWLIFSFLILVCSFSSLVLFFVISLFSFISSLMSEKSISLKSISLIELTPNVSLILEKDSKYFLLKFF